MSECFGKKFILNGTLQSTYMFDNAFVYKGESIYEVIRMKNGNPLFYEDHMERLQNSLTLQNKPLLADPQKLRKDITNLSKYDKKKDANLKIVFNYNRDSDRYLIYYIEPLYPTQMQYRDGVKGTLFYAERKDPVSKVVHSKLRSSIYNKLMMEGAYEALLVNENNFITEGSRSNIFFIKGDIFYTAPDDVILNGITRKYILQICNEYNFKVVKECINVDDISNFDGVFMTGTSPMVLPFSSVDKNHFDVDLPVIKLLRDIYIKKAEASIMVFRSELI